MKLEAEDIEACASVVIRLMAPRLGAIEQSIRELTKTINQNAQVSLPQPRQDSSTAPTIVTAKKLKEFTGLSSTTLWRLEKNGQFPQRIHLSTNRVGWLRNEIDEWVAKRRIQGLEN